MTSASLLQHHPYSIHTPEPEADESAVTGESILRKTVSWAAPFSSPSPRVQKSEYTRLQDHALGRKSLVQRLRSIRLPFVKRIDDYHPGEEWIRGVLFCAWGAGAILAVNIVLAVIAAGIAYSKSSADTHFAYAELYQGDCSITHGWVAGMHLFINALSTALLAASNYVMQCLNAPSRADVDKAHLCRRWLAIGTFSWRNFWVMDAKRKLLWCLLLISSFPTHMVYNSAIFSSVTTVGYGTVVIPNDLRRNQPLVNDRYATEALHDATGVSPSQLQSEIFNGTFQNLSFPDCVRKYAVRYNTEWSTLLLVSEGELVGNPSSLSPIAPIRAEDDWFNVDVPAEGNWMAIIRRWERYRKSEAEKWEKEDRRIRAIYWNYPTRSFHLKGSKDWLSFGEFLNAMFLTNTHDVNTLGAFVGAHNPDDEQLSQFLETDSNWLNSSWAAQVAFRTDAPSGGMPFGDTYHNRHYVNDYRPNITISHCMAKVADQQCQLYFSLPICLAVIGCNIAKVFCMILAARTNYREILLTIGDVLSSFLDRPDVTTKGRCFLSRSQMTRGPRAWNPDTNGSTDGIPLNDIPANRRSRQATYPALLPKRKRWWRAASWQRWTFTLLFSSTCFIVSVYLTLGTYGFGQPTTIAQAMGFGKPDSERLLTPVQNVLALILLANVPQLVFTTLYLLCNVLFSCMLSTAEYNDFATQRKPLRVSWPKGMQRSTYYLSLPYRYSGPLITVSIVMHWLLSRSIFLVKVNVIDVHGRQVNKLGSQRTTELAPVTACGFSPLPILITTVLGTTAILAMIGFAMRPLRSRMPLASYCSAAISASCHPPVDDTDASLKPVMWGEVSRDSVVGPDPSDTGQMMVGSYAHCTFTSKDVTTPNAIRLYC